MLQLAEYFAGKIDRIWADLNSGFEVSSSHDLLGTPSGPGLWVEFSIVQPEKLEKIVGEVRPTNTGLHGWGGLDSGSTPVINSSLRIGVLPTVLKQAIIGPLMKKTSLGPTELGNYRPVSKLAFLGKVIEWVGGG